MDNDVDVEKIVASLLQENAQLHLELAVLRSAIDTYFEIQSKKEMYKDAGFSSDAVEMLSKLEIK